VPLDIYIAEDKSGSMNDGADGGGPSKWQAVENAFTAFVQSSATAGIGVGLAFFAKTGSQSDCPNCNDATCLTECGCNGTSCTGSADGGQSCMCSLWGDSCLADAYAKPVVEIEPLPGVGQKIIDAFNAVQPNGGTPSRPALEGAIKHAKAFADANQHHVVVVMATDGEPEGCTTNTVTDVANAASAGVAEGILTYVIGVGSDLASLDPVAAAGGTGKAFIVDVGGNATQQFIDALLKIKATASLACNYTVPQPPDGGVLDPDKVNVELTEGTPPTTTIIKRVDGVSQCTSNGGWYYDNPMSPMQIIMCDATCKQLSAVTDATIDIELGCKTIVQPPQ
jgi:hypothetical protein